MNSRAQEVGIAATHFGEIPVNLHSIRAVFWFFLRIFWPIDFWHGSCLLSLRHQGPEEANGRSVRIGTERTRCVVLPGCDPAPSGGAGFFFLSLSNERSLSVRSVSAFVRFPGHRLDRANRSDEEASGITEAPWFVVLLVRNRTAIRPSVERRGAASRPAHDRRSP